MPALVFADYDMAYDSYQKGNFDLAFSEFSQMAKQGNINAQFYLGTMYRAGEGVDQDYLKSLDWYSKAAESGEPRAQHNVAMFYHKGLGVE